MAAAEMIPLSLLAGELAATGTFIPYQALYLLTVSGRVPFATWQRGRWYWRKDDLPVIREAVAKAMAERPRRRAA